MNIKYVREGVLGLLLTLMIAPFALAGQQTGSIEGRVLDWDRNPAAGSEVRVPALGRVARVGDDGRFVFTQIPAGRYVVAGFNETAGTMTIEVEVVAGRTVEIELQLDPLFHLEGVFVSVAGEPVTENDLYQAASALSGRDLRARLEASLGETLAKEPGVTSTYFGPASSRPVIRGLSGDRVRVLEAGIGTGDASTVSPDHAVSVESQLADRIEIIRGPATLLYGSSAIGGAVNVIDNRIPDELPAASVTGQLLANGGLVANERNVSGELNGAAGKIGWHVSGLFRETDDYEIPGPAEVEDEEEGEPEGILPNTFLETTRAAVGLSYVSTNGFLGASFSGYDSEYGVPPGAHGHEGEEGGEEPEEEEELVSIDLRQRRFDGRGEWRFGNEVLRGLRVRFGVTDYRHVELEGGETGTVFDNEEWETRVEGQTRFGDRVHGAVGLQLGNRDFSAIGEEAFTPPSDTDQLGLFTFQEVDLSDVKFQLGLRLETRDVTNTADGLSREFDDLSVSGGLNWSASEEVGLALSLSRSVKHPSVEELFSDGPHLATASFERGNPNLGTEKAFSADLTVRLDAGRVHGELAGFVNDFSDFVYQEFTGEEEDGLPVLGYTQADAVFSGLEGALEVDIADWRLGQLALDLSGDWVRAELSDTDTPLPRIAPARLGAGVSFRGAPWDGNFEVRRVNEQGRVAPNESPTEGYTTLAARVSYRVLVGGFVHEVVLQGRNLTDQEARNHVSLIKDFAPLPGRELRLMYRLAF